MLRTIRYSAPEVLNFEPRNRASDIYSLGCVLTEMMSGIEGINLTVVKEHWKRTENRQPSFAQNPGAGTAWLLRLQRLDWDEHEWPHHHWNSGHPKDHALTWFIPLLIHVNRSYRPTSQQVVNHVAYLDMAFFCEDHANECCIETAGSREVRIAFTAAKSMSCRYLDQFCWPWRYGWVYGLWDLHCNMVYTNEQSGTVDTSHVIGEHNHDHHLWIIENLYQVQKACSRILSVACKTGRTRKFWEAHKPGIGEDPSPEEVEHVKISAHAFSLQHAVFTRVALVGGWQTPFGDVELECMQITLLPVCLPRSPYYGNFFWMFSYIARDGGYIGGEGQTYDVIDLTKTS